MYIFSVFLLSVAALCNGNEIKTPLTVLNPLQAFQHHIKDMGAPSSELVSLENDLPRLIFSQKLNSTDDPCAESIVQFVKDLEKEEHYTLKVLDSWGKMQSGILEGNTQWLGKYYECISTETKSFKFQYYALTVLVAPIPGVRAGLSLGGCFPDTCSISNVSSLVNSFINGTIITTPVSYSKWMAKDIVGLVITCILSCLVVASTAYDYITEQRNITSTFSDQVMLTGPTEEPQIKQSNSHRVMTSFSLIQNTKRLLSTKQRAGDISCLHGMRFLSMSWVILGHSFYFPAFESDNIKFMARYMRENLNFQVIMNATFSVDSFFYLSGLLVAYLGLRQLRKRDGKMNVPMMYLHRYLRLTPPYGFVILITVSLYPKFGNGVLWSSVVEPLRIYCGKYWYSNLLYYNNLFPEDSTQECFSWGWYLANDTQFYLLAPIFLYFLYRTPKWGIALVSFVTLSSIAITGAFSSHTKQQPLTVALGQLAKYVSVWPFDDPTTSLSTLGSDKPPSVYMSDLYAKPWCRIGAYLVGMITGYILHASNNKVKMPKIAVVIGWVVAAGANLSMVYCLYPTISDGHSPDVNTAAFYNAVTRPVWCMGLAWVTIACVSGYGGPVNALLSWKGFIPLSRLTYCSYLIHPLVIWWFVLAVSEGDIHYSINAMMMVYMASLLFTTLLAYIVAMLVEFPVVELMKILQSESGRTATHVQHDATTNSNSSLLKVTEEDENEVFK